MGPNIAAGELLQLFVPGGWWKASEIPEEDLSKALVEGVQDRVGCLISEVVCPGWTIEQHKFLTKEKVSSLLCELVLIRRQLTRMDSCWTCGTARPVGRNSRSIFVENKRNA